MKRIFAFILAVIFTLTQPAITFAADSPALPGLIKGTIVSATDKTIECKPDNGGDNLILNLGDMPVIVDYVSGRPVALKDRTNDSVAAYYGPAVTKSIPPQSNAIVVMLNATDGMPPH